MPLINHITGTNTNDATATAADILSPKTAYVKGELITGEIETKDNSDLTVSGATVSVPAGYYEEAASKSVTTVTHPKPSATFNSSTGTFTASHTQSTGYVTGGTTTATSTITVNDSSDLTASGATVSVPAGYYASAASKSVATATQATPTISVSSAGKITASSTQTAGYVSAGTKSATKQLTTQAAKTWTPSTSSQSIAAGTYLTGKQTIAAIPSSYIQPTIMQAAKTWTPTTTDQTIAAGTYCSGEQIIKGEPNLFAENLPRGLTLYGIEGTRRLQHEYWDDTITISASTRDFKIPVDGLPQDGFPSCVHMRCISATSISKGAVVAVGSSWKYSTFAVHDGWTYVFEIDDRVTTGQSGDYLLIEPPGSTSNFFPAGSYYVYLEFHYMYDGY